MDAETPPAKIYAVELECPAGTTVYTSPFHDDNSVGWYRTCVLNHGPFYAWKDDKLFVQGAFVNGKKEGTFISYDEEGVVTGKEHFVNGEKTP